MTDPNSMINWFPAVQASSALYPRTIMVRLDHKKVCYALVDGDKSTEEDIKKVFDEAMIAGESIGYPLFMRTDLSSGKHSWVDTCFVASIKDIPQHIYNLVEHSFLADMMGLNCEWLVLREFLPLKHSFTAFKGMPVAREYRYFAKGDTVLCRHPYWPEDAFEDGFHQPPKLAHTDWATPARSSVWSLRCEPVPAAAPQP